MLRQNIKAAVTCILIVSIFGGIYFYAFGVTSIAQPANGSYVSGYIFDKDGKRITGAEVKIALGGYALRIPNNPTLSGDGSASPMGFYEFKGDPGNGVIIAPGTAYDIMATKDGHSVSTTITMASGNNTVNLTLSDYAQPTPTPEPTATPSPTPLHRASVTMIPGGPVVTKKAIQPTPTAEPSANASATATVTSVPGTPTPSGAKPTGSTFLGTFLSGAFVVACAFYAFGRMHKK